MIARIATCRTCLAALHRTLIAASLAIVAACGSGSSGFDGEAAAIEAAAEFGICLEFEGTTYCGSGAELRLDDDDDGRVAIEQPGREIECSEVPSEDVCVGSVTFTTEDLPAGTAYLVATGASAEGPWNIAEDVPAPGSGAPNEDRSTDVEVPTMPGAPQETIVVAVLLYLDGLPHDVPHGAARLSDFGADAVYVTGELDLDVTD
ncbi:MAG TPA: hypothetical protein VEC57_18760 [Candidatus Limnocylindrales bacterium]|nr:hypothetical protein [Candidatus Limnocylindrales bacterium]